MISEQFVVGLDLGTTNVKALLFSLTGQVIAEKEDRIETVFLDGEGGRTGFPRTRGESFKLLARNHSGK